MNYDLIIVPVRPVPLGGLTILSGLATPEGLTKIRKNRLWFEIGIQQLSAYYGCRLDFGSYGGQLVITGYTCVADDPSAISSAAKEFAQTAGRILALSTCHILDSRLTGPAQGTA